MRLARLISLAALAACAFAPAAAGQQLDPIDRSQAPAPDGTPMCAQWVHDRHVVVLAGRSYATWHPPKDPQYRCAFGHEHGSDPRAFRMFRRVGMPAFGLISQVAGSPEAHAGFKVFVANNDRRGLAWMVTLHQGSSSPRRGTIRHHSLELWLYRLRGRRLVAHTLQMADFGAAVANCPGLSPQPSTKVLPHPSCPAATEWWTTALDVGGVLKANPTFAIDDPVTQFDPANPEAVIPNKPAVCGPPGWDSRCKGDRRAVLHPRWVTGNTGPTRFRTDLYGVRAADGPLPQYVSNRIRVNQRRECCGVESSFVVERITDGGLYRSGRGGRSVKFEQGYCVIGPN